MNVSTALQKIRLRLSDWDGEESFGDEELLDCVNMAVSTVVRAAVFKGTAAHFRQRLRVAENTTIPDGFIAFAGNYFVDLYGGAFHLNGEPSFYAFYFSMPALSDSLDDTIPVPESMIPEVILAATAYAKRRNELDITQDMAAYKAITPGNAVATPPVPAATQGYSQQQPTEGGA